MNSLSWLPQRKVFAGGLAGLLAWLVVFLVNKYLHWEIDENLQASLIIVIGYGISYLIPSSIKDVVNNLNNEIIKIAAKDPNSPVSERTMILPETAKVVSVTTPGPVVAVPPAVAAGVTDKVDKGEV